MENDILSKDTKKSTQLVILLFIIALISLFAIFGFKSSMTNSKLINLSSDFNQSSDFNEKFKIYQKNEDILNSIKFKNHQNKSYMLALNNHEVMKSYFIRYYENNINSNDLGQIKESGMSMKEIDESVKSAYENLLNIKYYMERDSITDKSEINKLQKAADSQIEKYEKEYKVAKG